MISKFKSILLSVSLIALSASWALPNLGYAKVYIDNPQNLRCYIENGSFVIHDGQRNVFTTDNWCSVFNQALANCENIVKRAIRENAGLLIHTDRSRDYYDVSFFEIVPKL